MHLFEAIGVELEYMIVSDPSLDVAPIADRLLEAGAGEPSSDVERDSIAWSNELTLHVVELKTNGPAASLSGLTEQFQENVTEINRLLEPLSARLMPTAMHPWMDPDREMRLWPHDNRPIYEAFDRVFDCRGHGWANLQSMHLNLPFEGDEEFGRLHAAVRLVLPILPALAASSPIIGGAVTGRLDSRLDVYRSNARRIASITGRVIPEQAFSEGEYDRLIFQPMFRDIAPFDPEGILQEEFLNARGAIARFSRGSIEIRVIDVQESPTADLAIAAATWDLLQRLVAEDFTSSREQRELTVADLEAPLLCSINDAEQAVIDNPHYLRQFGLREKSVTAAELWDAIIGGSRTLPAWSRPPLDHILQFGPLSRRLLRRLGPNPSQAETAEVYRVLCDNLREGSQFQG